MCVRFSYSVCFYGMWSDAALMCKLKVVASLGWGGATSCQHACCVTGQGIRQMNDTAPDLHHAHKDRALQVSSIANKTH